MSQSETSSFMSMAQELYITVAVAVPADYHVNAWSYDLQPFGAWNKNHAGIVEPGEFAVTLYPNPARRIEIEISASEPLDNLPPHAPVVLKISVPQGMQARAVVWETVRTGPDKWKRSQVRVIEPGTYGELEEVTMTRRVEIEHQVIAA
jgi:hypothetical protein